MMISAGNRTSEMHKKHVSFKDPENTGGNSLVSAHLPKREQLQPVCVNKLRRSAHPPKREQLQPVCVKKLRRSNKDSRNVTSQVKKVLIRNSEEPVTSKKVVKETKSERIPITGYTYTHTSKPSNVKQRYSDPELYSALSVAKKIQSTAKEGKKPTISDTSKMPVIAKEAVEDQVANKLNFGVDEELYSDLVNLSVKDEPVPKPGKKKVKKFKRKLRDPVPVLDTSCTALCRMQFLIKEEIPPFVLPKEEKVEYTVPSITDRMKIWRMAAHDYSFGEKLKKLEDYEGIEEQINQEFEYDPSFSLEEDDYTVPYLCLKDM